MKKIYLSFLFLTFTLFVNATDRLVDEAGGGGSFTSIAAAVTAASDGDRIVIKNKAASAPWIENITINKSLLFLSFQADTFFIVQGNYTITPAVGRTVSFIGMKNVSGNITASGNSPVGTRTTVNVMSSYFVSGNVDLAYNYFDVNIVASQFNAGSIAIQHGSIIGNQITNVTNHTLVITSDAVQNGDIVKVIGNKIYNIDPGYYGIFVNTNSCYVRIKNNYIKHSGQGIQLYGAYNTSSKTNEVYNNTIESYSLTTLTVGIYIYNTPSAAFIELKNNVIDENTTGASYAVYLSLVSGTVDVNYNHIDISHTDFIFGTPSSNFSNDSTTTFTLLTEGKLNTGMSAIDGGAMDVMFTDLDLTMGDAGAYGGPYTLDNYFPLFLGSARVYDPLFTPIPVKKGSTYGYTFNVFSRDLKITQGESFWNTDPGFGNGTVHYAVDGSFDEAIETNSTIGVFTGYLNVGLNVLYTRTKGTGGVWGPAYGVVIEIDTFVKPDVAIFGPTSGFCATGNLSGNYFADSVATYAYEWTLVSGGTFTSDSTKPAVSIDWNTSGPYSLRLKECNSFGCDSTNFSVNVTNITAPIVSSNTPVCEGDTLLLFAGAVSGATSYTWNGPNSFTSASKDPWIPIATMAAAGTYSVSASDYLGCLGDTSTTVVVITTNPVPLITQVGDTLISSFTDSLQWYFNGSLMIGATNDTLGASQSGFYVVTSTNVNGCVATSAPYNYIFVGMKNNAGQSNDISIYPNPSNGNFAISMTASGQMNVSITNVLGETVFSESIYSNGKYTRNIDQKFSSGVYLVRIRTNDEQFVQKLIVE